MFIQLVTIYTGKQPMKPIRVLPYNRQRVIGRIMRKHNWQGTFVKSKIWLIMLANFITLGRHNRLFHKMSIFLQHRDQFLIRLYAFPPATAHSPPPHSISVFAANAISSSFVPATSRLCASWETVWAMAPFLKPNPFTKPQPFVPVA